MTLPSGIRTHVERSRIVGFELCSRYGIEHDPVDLAILAHDLFRSSSRFDLLNEAYARGWEPDPIECTEPMLLHGPLAGLWLLQEAGVDSLDVIDAVMWHTTYGPGLGATAAVVFLADKLDPHKIKERPWLDLVLDSCLKNSLASAIELYLSKMSKILVDTGRQVHPRMIEAMNSLRTK